MRHYTVTFLTRAGMTSEFIVMIMGWKSDSMYRIYNDLTGKEREWKELDKLKEHLSK
jgi:intergrase/recombinase